MCLSYNSLSVALSWRAIDYTITYIIRSALYGLCCKYDTPLDEPCHLRNTPLEWHKGAATGWGGETTGDCTTPTHGGRAVNIQVTEQQADLLDDNRATAQTVQRMCELVNDAAGDPLIESTARSIVNVDDLHSRQKICAAAWDWCKQNIRFVPDEEQLMRTLNRTGERELLISPSVMIRPELLAKARGVHEMQGDCDDFVTMLRSLIGVFRVPTVTITLKCERKDHLNRWSHVCSGAVLEDGSLFPLDASHGDYPGWSVPAQDVFEYAVWDSAGRKIGGRKGMGFTRRGGMGAYRNMPGWTGNPMSSVTGPEAGPYSPANDIRTLYQKQCDRMAGLGYIRRAGMGAPTVEGDYSTYYETPPASTSDDSGGGFDYGSFFSNLFKAGAQVGSAALGTGNKIVSGVPAGYAVNSAGQLVKVGAASSLGISTNTLLIGGGLLLGVVFLISLKK